MKRDFVGKRLLVLGGAPQHEKVVETARDLKIYTVVTDNNDKSSAKKLADKAYCIDIYDIKALLKLCKSERIDGVISTSLDPCQNPYVELCEKAGYFCYGTKEQFSIMTNKKKFKDLCKKSAVSVVDDLDIKDLEHAKKNIYPVIVKPVDSRGSRGQTICNSFNELEKAIIFAKDNSLTGHCIVEKYIEDGDFFQVTYFCVNKQPYLIRTVDGYCGSKEMGLNRVVSCAVSPSRFTEYYMKTEHNNVIQFIRTLGVINGPVFMQGIVKENKFYFFDPGLRFPGVDYEKIYKKIYDLDLMKAMISISLFGDCGELHIPSDSVWLSGKKAAILFPILYPGKVGRILKENEIIENNNVISYLPRYGCGDTVLATYDIARRHSEIDILADTTRELKKSINRVFSTLKVEDVYGKDMICGKFDTSKIDGEIGND